MTNKRCVVLGPPAGDDRLEAAAVVANNAWLSADEWELYDVTDSQGETLLCAVKFGERLPAVMTLVPWPSTEEMQQLETRTQFELIMDTFYVD